MTQPKNNRIRHRRDRQVNVRPIESLEQRLMLSDGAFLYAQRDLDHGPIGPNVRLNVPRRGLRAPTGEVLLDITASSLAGDQLNPKGVLFRGRNRPEIVQQVKDVPGGSSSSVLVMAGTGNYIMRMQTDRGDSGGYAIDAALAGDVNGDFQVTGKDLRTIARGISEKSGVEQYMSSLDIDHDGTVTGEDVAMARRNLGVRITPFPHRLEDPSHHGIYTVPGAETQPADLTFDWLYRRASFKHEVGIFVTDDAGGRIDGMSPGDTGYGNAAMSDDRRTSVFMPTDRVGSSKHVQLDSGTNFGVYMISNINQSPTSTQRVNRLIQRGRVFFSLDDANKNGFAQFKALSGHRFAFEDQSGGGDKDFNDFIGRIRFPERMPAVNPDVTAPEVSFDQVSGLLGNTNLDLSGLVTDDETGIQSAEYRMDDGAIQPLPLDSSSGFDIATSLAIDGSQDGSHTIRVRATDNAGNRSDFFPWDFGLDTTAPIVSVNLDPADAISANTTVAPRVALIGHTEPELELAIEPGGLTTVADSSGGFRFENVPISIGTDTFRVTTQDKVGNRSDGTTTITRLPQGELSVHAFLLNDTSPQSQNNDGVTSDPSVGGSVDSVHPVASLQARIVSLQADFVDADQWLDSSNNFEFDRTALETILAGSLSDGPLTIEILAKDDFGFLSDIAALPLVLDTTPPFATLDLDPTSDSGTIGDGVTDKDNVAVLGQTEPNVFVELSPSGLIATSDSLGDFNWSDIALVSGPNDFSLSVTDIAGNRSVTDVRFERVAPPPLLVASLANDTSPIVDPTNINCEFDDDLSGWTTSTSDAGTGGGGVLASGCSAILVEGESFTVTLSRDLQLLNEPALLSFSYRELDFDATNQFIRDAFEVSIVDEFGRSIVHTIAPGRDAFFNITESLTEQVARDVQTDGATVTVPIPSSELGKFARLSFQLINNDGDTASTIRISDVSVKAVGQSDPGGSGNLGGDQITSDISISGSIAGERVIEQLMVGLDNMLIDDYQDVLPDIAIRPNGSFHLSMDLIDRIISGGISDGQHMLHLLAVAEGQVESNVVELPFQFDTTTPRVSATLLLAEGVIEIQFDDIVNDIAFDSAAYSIIDELGKVIATPTLVQTIDSQTVRVTLPNDLANGSYQLRISNEVRDQAGNPVVEGRTVGFDISQRPSSVVEISPHSGEQMVSPQRKAIVRFNTPIDPTSITADSFYLIANGERLGGAIKVSSTNLFATFMPDQPLQSSTEVRIVVEGDMILDAAGNPIDGDRNGLSGGRAIADFRTLSLTRIQGTTVFGYVYDSYNKNTDGSDRPVVGATIRVDAFPEASVVTDQNGFFELVDMPAPEFFVHIDGSTATNAPTGTRYPVVGKPFHSIPGQRVQLEMDGAVFDIYLPPMAGSDIQDLSDAEDTSVGFGESSTALLTEQFPQIDPEIWDQVSITYPAGSAQDDNGNLATRAAIIPVPPDRIPAPLPAGLDSSLVISVQAQTEDGTPVTNFDVPAPVSFPNLDGIPEGEKVLLMSFNHAAGRWEATGTMTSTGDMVVSDPGTGIRAPGWHVFSDGIILTGGQVLATRGGLFGRTGSDRLAPQTGTHHYAIEDLDSGFVIRGIAEVADKLLEQVILTSRSRYRLSVFQPYSLKIGEAEFQTGRCVLTPFNTNLCQQTLPPVILDRVVDADSDGEGLIDRAEFIVGTAINNPDTDSDGITDLAEIRQRTDPFDGRAFPTGIIADLPLRGEAKEIVVAESIDGSGTVLAYIATGSHGLAIVDVTRFDQPVVLGQLELAGDAVDVAVDQQLGIVAVVSDQIGFSVIDVSDPMIPILRDTVSLPASSVVISEGLAYISSEIRVHVYDVLSTERLESIIVTPNTVKDVAIDGSMLYVIDDLNLSAVEITPAGLVAHSTIALPDESFTLFVGNDIAYVASNVALSRFSAGYATFDVSNPDDLRLLGSANDTIIASGDIALNGSGLGVMVGPNLPGGGEALVWVVDTSDPTDTGAAITAFDPPDAFSGPTSATIAGGIALVTNHLAGMFIVNYLSFDSNGVPPTVTAELFDEIDIDPTKNGIQIQEGQSVAVQAQVIDDVQARSIELLLNDRVVSSDITFPWNLEAILPEIRDGISTAQLQVRAIDTGGNVGLSNPIDIELVPDTFAPGIIAVTPSDGQLRSVNQRTVRVVFTESMAANTLTSDNIRLRGPGGRFIEPSVVQTRAKDHVVQFDFEELPVGEYAILMNAEKLTDRAGNPLGDGTITSTFAVVNATAVWTNAVGGNWDNPLNWDVERVPGPDDDVLISIPGNVSVTHVNGDTIVRSLISTNPFVHANGSIEAETIELHTRMTMLGGTLVGATIVGQHGGDIIMVRGGLDDVTLDIDLVVPNANKFNPNHVQIYNDLTINRDFYVGSDSFLTLRTHSTFDGHGALNLAGGGFYGASFNLSGKTLTVARDLTVTAGAAHITGGAVINDARMHAAETGKTFRISATLINQGTIGATEGGTLRLDDPHDLENIDLRENSRLEITGGTYGIIQDITVPSGAVLKLGGDWTNLSTITVVDSVLDLSGTFSLPDLGQIVRVGNTGVQVSGRFVNTDDTLILDETTGNWNLTSGGYLEGGTIEGRDGAFLGLTGGRIDNVTFNIDVVFYDSTKFNSKSVQVLNGLTINRDFIVGTNSTVQVDSDALIDGRGTLQLNGRLSFYGANLSLLTNVTVTIGPDLSVTGGTAKIIGGTVINQGAILSSVPGEVFQVTSEFINQGILLTTGDSRLILGNTRDLGTVDLRENSRLEITGGQYEIRQDITVPSGAFLKLGGDWINSSTINVVDSVLDLSGVFSLPDLGQIVRTGNTGVQVSGRFVNTDETLILDETTGNWNLVSGGYLEGGTIEGRDGAFLGLTGGRIDNVTFDIDVVFYDFTKFNSKQIQVFNGLTINRDFIFGTNTSVRVDSDTLIDGQGTLQLNGRRSFYGSNMNLLSNVTVTIGSDLTFTGSTAHVSGGTVINDGTILSGVAGERLRISSELINRGTIQPVTSGALLDLIGSVTNEGTIEALIGTNIEIHKPLVLPDTSRMGVTVAGTSTNSLGRFTLQSDFTFDGTLTITLGEGYQPSEGESFTIFSGGNRLADSTFDLINGLNLPNGLVLNPVYSDDGLTLVAAQPLLATGSVPDSTSAQAISSDQLDVIVDAAIERWISAGIGSEAAGWLNQVTVRIDDLPGHYLGFAARDIVWIDKDAANRGWFVDSTPSLNEEFRTVIPNRAFQAEADSEPHKRIDLLTVVSHELGHVLGLADLDPGVYPYDLLAGSLDIGQRRIPTTRVAQSLPSASDRSNLPPVFGPMTIDDRDDLTNRGREFWLTFPTNLALEQEDSQLSLRITGSALTSGTVEIPGIQFSQRFNVFPNEVTEILLPREADLGFTSNQISNKGIHVTATAPVAVFGVSRAIESTDAFLGLPTALLGTEYIVLTYQNLDRTDQADETFPGTELAIVATSDGTNVSITPSVSSAGNAAGIPFLVTLNRGETYLLQNSGFEPSDLTGTMITSDHPIAVFGAHAAANVPSAAVGFADHIVEQLPPTNAWGTEFLTAPLKNRAGGDTFRILAADDATTVDINGLQVANLNRGQMFEQIIDGPAVIRTSGPALVAQYAHSAKFDQAIGDPFMMLIPSTNQLLPSYTIPSGFGDLTEHYVNVLVPDAAVDSTLLDGQPIPPGEFAAITGSGFSVAQVELTGDQHHLSSPLPMAAYVYGFGQDESYGYPAGMKVDPPPAPSIEEIILTPEQSERFTSTVHTVTATVLDDSGGPVGGVDVEFTVRGANESTGVIVTNLDGSATFSYTGLRIGSDQISASTGNLMDAAGVDWIVNAPTITIDSPTNASTFAVGRQVLISGQATPGGAGVILVGVSVNGSPVDVFGSNGEFFTQTTVRQGENIYEFEAMDELRQTTKTSISLFGIQAQAEEAQVDMFGHDVTNSFSVEYGRTSFNDETDELFVEFAVRNTGQFPVDAPLLVGIDHISNPTVQVRGEDGATSSGIPYFDLSEFIGGDSLQSNELSDSITIRLFNTGNQFDYDLVFFAQLNEAPEIISIPPIELITEDVFQYQLAATDPDGDFLSFAKLAGPKELQVNPITGLVEWSATTGDLGTHSVVLAASDDRGGRSEQHFVLTVINQPSNRPPVFQSIPSVNSNIGSEYIYQPNVIDLDGDDLSFQLIESPQGATVNATTGSVTWFPDASQFGVQLFDLQVSDGRNGVSNQSYSVAVGGELGNRDPVIVSIPIATATENRDYEYQIQSFDSDNDVLTFRLTTAPGGMNIDQTGLIEWNRADVVTGLHQVAIQVDDGRGGFDSQSFTLTAQPEPSNDDPVISSTPPTQARVDGRLGYFVIANDPEGSALTYSITGPSGMTIGTTGLLQWIPDATQLGVHSVIITVQDNRDGLAEQSFNVDVLAALPNSVPTIISSPVLDAIAERQYEYQVIAADPDGDLLTFELVKSPEGMEIDQLSGMIRWIPTAQDIFDAEEGLANVEIQVSDGRGGNNTQQFDILVRETDNLAPTITSEFPGTAVVGEMFRYEVTAKDLDTDPLVFGLEVAPTGMTIDPATGVIAWRPRPEHIESINHQVVVSVSDNRGGIDVQLFPVLVVIPNTRPVITSHPVQIAGVDRPYEYRVKVQDADGDSILFRLDAASSGMTLDETTGIFRWTPTDAQLGDHTVTIIVNDGQLDDETVFAQDVQSFTVTVVETIQNEPPKIVSTPRESTRQNELYFYQVEVEDPNADAISYDLDFAPGSMTVDDDGLITWRPLFDSVGRNFVELRVSDGHGGVDTQSFTIDVSSIGDNNHPVISSNPTTVALVDQSYQYDLKARDPDGDFVMWELADSPAGMSINQSIGTVRWLPGVGEVGSHTVVVQARDMYGGQAEQTFDLVVRPINSPPVIISSPVTEATADIPYIYAVRAIDGEMDELNYMLTSGPTGMQIDHESGLVLFNGDTQSVGQHPVSIQVDDGFGGISVQNFDLNISNTRTTGSPSITSTPPLTANLGDLYEYSVTAFDPDDDSLTFSLDEAPAGMQVNEETGQLQWSPTTDQLGTTNVTISVSDGSNKGTQSYAIRVLSVNTSPVINSQPSSEVAAGSLYRYDVLASDTDGDRLSYELLAGANGMSIDALGMLRFATNSTHVGLHRAAIRVSDSRGGFADQSFTFDVTPDTEPPMIDLLISQNPVQIGTQVIVIVRATDNVEVDSHNIIINGKSVPIDSNGRVTITAEQPGRIEIVGSATDSSGNVGSEGVGLIVIDPTDADAPLVEITSPQSDSTIATPTDVIGTVMDDNLVSYTLEIAPLNGVFHTIASGTETLENGVLGTFDPTMLQNDVYLLRLSALDAGGNQSVVHMEVSVSGGLKLGNFQLSFVDLAIPLSGIPITIVRTYDTLDAQRTRDLGYGWRLDLHDTDLRTNVRLTGYEDDLIYNSFYRGARVFVSLPGGERAGFTFEPKPAPGLRGSFLGISRPSFVPDPGVQSELSVEPFDIIESGRSFVSFGSNLVYNPISPAFGGTFTVTTREGFKYKINGRTGSATSAEDPSGNTIEFRSNGVFSSSGVNVRFDKNADGSIAAVIDPDGNQISYSYNDHGDLVEVTDREGHSTVLEYLNSPAHYLDKVVDPLGRTGVRAEYGSDGRLRRVSDAAGHGTSLSYDLNGDQFRTINALGQSTTYVYDDDGNLTTVVNPDGGVVARVYDSNGRVLSMTDPIGATTSFELDAAGNEQVVIDALGHSTVSSFMPNGEVLAVTDSLGSTTTSDYDSKGNPVSYSLPDGVTYSAEYAALGQPSRIVGPDGSTTEIAYKSESRPSEVKTTLGAVENYVYDSNGRVINATVEYSTGSGTTIATTTTLYDLNGQVLSVTDPLDNVTEYEYDAVGNQTAVIDQLGRRTESVFDELNQLIEVVYSDGSTIRSEYNALGLQVSATDEMGRTTYFEYDSMNRLTTTVLPDETPNDLSDNPKARTEYDAAGRILAEVSPTGSRTEFEYDMLGQLVRQRDPQGNDEFFEYDAVGRLIKQTNSSGETSLYEYDEAGRRIGVQFSDGSSTRTIFNEAGLPATVIDSQGRSTTYEFTSDSQIAAVIDPLGQRTDYEFDQLGNITKVVDALGNETLIDYDQLGRRISRTLPRGQVESLEYDAVGNLAKHTDFNGQETTYSYDARNRLVQETFSNGESASYTYYPNGLRASAITSQGTTSYEYDLRGKLSKVTNPDGGFVQYTYDDAGRRSSYSTQTGTTEYSYDATGHLASVQDTADNITSYSYDNLGNLVQTSFANGLVEDREYDELNRLVRIKTSSSEAVLEDIRYTLTDTGLRSVMEDLGSRNEYEYDALGRLTRETVTIDGASAERDFQYDTFGNLVTLTTDGRETIYEYNENQQLVQQSDGSTTVQFAYDENGNRIQRTEGQKTTLYSYDSNNRLVQVETVDGLEGSLVQYGYDVAGNLASRTVDGVETTFLVDTNRTHAEVIEEHTSDGVVTEITHGRETISQSRSGEVRVHHSDALGSTRLLTDNDGEVTDTYRYNANGSVQSSTGDTENSYLFAGERRDDLTELDYLRARFLDVELGRFISRDEFEGVARLPITANPYLYANASPTNHTDPSGHFTLAGLSIASAIQGVLRGLDTSARICGPLATANNLAFIAGMGATFAQMLGAMFGGLFENASHRLQLLTISIPKSSKLGKQIASISIGGSLTVNQQLDPGFFVHFSIKPRDATIQQNSVRGVGGRLETRFREGSETVLQGVSSGGLAASFSVSIQGFDPLKVNGSAGLDYNIFSASACGLPVFSASLSVSGGASFDFGEVEPTVDPIKVGVSLTAFGLVKSGFGVFKLTTQPKFGLKLFGYDLLSDD